MSTERNGNEIFFLSAQDILMEKVFGEADVFLI